MIPLWLALLMIPATWAAAFALIPWASRYEGSIPLIALLALGCSGAIAALVLLA